MSTYIRIGKVHLRVVEVDVIQHIRIRKVHLRVVEVHQLVVYFKKYI